MLSPIDYCRWLWRHLAKNPSRQTGLLFERLRYAQLWRKQLCSESTNALIKHLLINRQPCLIGRIGHTEGRIVGEALFRGQVFGRLTKKEAHQFSGIFPVTPKALAEFASIYADSIAIADLLGFWQTAYQAMLLAKRYPEMPLAPLSALEPYLHESPWSEALEHRRVLVVHPFATSIARQFKMNRVKLFANSRILPEFEIQVLAPPQTLAPLTGGFSTWFEAFDHLTQSVLGREFDVALLGCGAYGLPLGAAIKRSGRQAIHLGGALQVLFGIRGRRWERMPSIAALMNDHWIRPSKQETPVSASSVDGGCYW